MRPLVLASRWLTPSLAVAQGPEALAQERFEEGLAAPPPDRPPGGFTPHAI